MGNNGQRPHPFEVKFAAKTYSPLSPTSSLICQLWMLMCVPPPTRSLENQPTEHEHNAACRSALTFAGSKIGMKAPDPLLPPLQGRHQRK